MRFRRGKLGFAQMTSQRAACRQAGSKMCLMPSTPSLPSLLSFLPTVQGGAFSEVPIHLNTQCSRGSTEQTRFDGASRVQGACPRDTMNSPWKPTESFPETTPVPTGWFSEAHTGWFSEAHTVWSSRALMQPWPQRPFLLLTCLLLVCFFYGLKQS